MDRFAQLQRHHPLAYRDALALARQHHTTITVAVIDCNCTLYYGDVHPAVPSGCRHFCRVIVPVTG